MSTNPGSTFDAMEETSVGAPEPVLPEPVLGCDEPGEEPPAGEAMDAGVEPCLPHSPWPMPTPPASNKIAAINRATALEANFRSFGSSDRGGLQYGFGSAQADCHGPASPTPGGVPPPWPGAAAKSPALGTEYGAVGGPDGPTGAVGGTGSNHGGVAGVGGSSFWSGGIWANGFSASPSPVPS